MGFLTGMIHHTYKKIALSVGDFQERQLECESTIKLKQASNFIYILLTHPWYQFEYQPDDFIVKENDADVFLKLVISSVESGLDSGEEHATNLMAILDF